MVVFYAGHGVETGGVDYLVPVDAAIGNETDLQTTALALQDLTAAASKARQGALVIIDACRDDPFVEAKAVASSRGLARVSADRKPSKAWPTALSNILLVLKNDANQRLYGPPCAPLL